VQADRSYCKVAIAAEEAGKEQQAENHIEDVEACDYSCCMAVVVVQAHHKSPQHHNQREVAAAAVGCHYYTLGMIGCWMVVLRYRVVVVGVDVPYDLQRHVHLGQEQCRPGCSE
jgi:hypothetical protein